MINDFRGDYRWLSNFYPCNVKYLDMVFTSVEHAYQAAKSEDVEVRGRISYLISPAEAKSAGKTIEIRKDWKDVKLDIMENLLRQKFCKGSELSYRLLDTNDEELIEGNTWGDKFWGVCNGVGKNNLGKLLMKIRNDLREDSLRNI